MNKRFYNMITNVVAVVVISTSMLFGCLQLSDSNFKIKTGEQVVNLMYKANDVDILYANADKLESLCEPDVFALMDNRIPANLMRRIPTNEPIIPHIVDYYTKGDKAIFMVTFRTGSKLNDRYISIEFSKDGLVHDYAEYEIINKFKEE